MSFRLPFPPAEDIERFEFPLTQSEVLAYYQKALDIFALATRRYQERINLQQHMISLLKENAKASDEAQSCRKEAEEANMHLEKFRKKHEETLSELKKLRGGRDVQTRDTSNG